MGHNGQVGVYFENNGNKLLGTLFLAQGDTPKATAIILHGIPGIEKNYDLALMLRENGWNSLIFHYQGCWGSEGNYTLKTIPSDVHTAIDYLSSGQHPQIDPSRLFLIGHSLGGWAAVLAAVNETRLQGIAIYGAVCDSRTLKFSAKDAIEQFTPWLSGLSAEEFIRQWEALDDNYIPSELIAKLKIPMLLIHATHDEVVPIQQAEILFERASVHKQLQIHNAANHAFTWHREWLRQQIWTWIQARL